MIAAGDIHACTDITGFGFLGHACEMIEGSDVGMNINSAAVPIFIGLQELVETGFVPGGLYRNKNFRISQIETADTCPAWLLDVFFDPQTAGGLFFSLPQKQAQNLVEKCVALGLAMPLLSVKLLPIIPVKFYLLGGFSWQFSFTPEP